MFRNSRPVPSPAALKVLYQLAYISSGTAVGLAALCAEERRRRIQIVQRIADNAKAIRQHPRYAQTAALASRDEDDQGFFGRISQPESHRGRRRTRRKHLQNLENIGNEGAKGPHLPSIVEKEYAETFGSDHKRLRRRKAQVSPHAAVASSESLAGQRSNADNVSTLQRHTNRLGEYRRVQTRGMRRPARAGESFVFQSVPMFQSDPNTAISTCKEHNSWLRRGKAASRRLGHSYLTKRAWARQALSDGVESAFAKYSIEAYAISAENISHDVDFFFEFGPPPDDLDSRHKASQLLRLAIERGSLDDIRSLCLWMLNNGSFRVEDSRNLVDARVDLASRLGQQSVFDFYAGVFATSAHSRLDPTEVFEQTLKVLITATRWDLGLNVQEIGRALFAQSLCKVDVADVTRILPRECKELVANDEISLAADTLLAVADLLSREKGSIHTHFIPLVNEVLDAALRVEHLSSCIPLLKWKFSLSENAESARIQVNAFIRACGRKRMYTLLLALPRKDMLAAPFKKILRLADETGKAILAVACSTNERFSSVFQSIYRQLSRQKRQDINEHSTAMAITAKWKATRNLESIQAEVPLLSSWLSENNDTRSLRKLDEALLEIYISADRLDLALACIARINSTNEADSVTLSLAALLFAKRDAWDRLTRLLEISECSKSLNFNVQTTRVFNKVFNLYSQQHTAKETVQLVTAMMDKFKFAPNVATTQVVMKCCVSKHRIDLIPQWLTDLTARGHRFDLNGKFAAELLTRCYLDNRETMSHVIVFWLCRHLTLNVPSTNAEEFVDLLKEAIGYDLREQAGYNAYYLRQHAQERLERLNSVKGYIPQPGFNRFGKLFFSDHDEMQQHSLQSSHYQQQALESGTEQQNQPHSAHFLKNDHREDLATTSFKPFETLKNPNLDDKRLHPVVTSQPENEASQQSMEVDAFQRSNGFPPQQEQQSSTSSVFPRRDHEERYHEIIAAFNDDIPENGGQKAEEHEVDATFQELRSNYLAEHQDEDHSEAIVGGDEHRQLERKMILAMSLAKYQEVLDLYHSSVDATGLPASVRTLEVAVEASLRLHNSDRSHAEELMAAARDAGMNVTCAMGPLLIHQIKQLDIRQKQDVSNLRTTVIEYYRMNDENGWHVQHHVGVTAANVLIRQGRPEHGLNILSAIYRSEWAAHRSFDIAGLTVFLSGYKALQSLAGIRWVVRTVLTKDIPISRKFLFHLGDAGRGSRGMLLRRQKALIMSWLNQCRERRRKQMVDSLKLGYDLVECIAKCKERQDRPHLEQTDEKHKLAAFREPTASGPTLVAEDGTSNVDVGEAVSPQSFESTASTRPRITSHRAISRRRIRTSRLRANGSIRIRLGTRLPRFQRPISAWLYRKRSRSQTRLPNEELDSSIIPVRAIDSNDLGAQPHAPTKAPKMTSRNDTASERSFLYQPFWASMHHATAEQAAHGA